MPFSGRWCLDGDHPGQIGCWKIAVAATVATGGASNLSLGEYQICYSSQLFGGSLLCYVSSDVCTVLWPAMYTPDSSGSPHCFALEQQQHAQMLSRGFADSEQAQPKKYPEVWNNLFISGTRMHSYCVISHHSALAPSIRSHQKPLLEILLSPGCYLCGDSLSTWIPQGIFWCEVFL